MDLRRLSFAPLLVVVTLAPLPFGSAEDYWLAAWGPLLAASLAACDLSGVRTRRLRALAPAAAVLALYLALVAAQSLPWAPTAADPIWREAAGLLGQPLPSYAGASRGGAWAGLGASLAFATAFFSAYLHGLDPRRARILSQAVAVSGLAYAVWGIGELLLEPTSLLWRERTAYIGDLTGPFVNRNTAATYFGACALVWLGLAADQFRRDLRASEAAAVTHWAHFAPSNRLALACAGFGVCLLAVFLTRSRAGTLLTLAAVVVVGGRLLVGQFPRGARAALAVAALLAAVGAIAEIWGGLVALRVANQGLFDDSRWLAYQGTWAMALDHPWLGAGLRSFEEAFPAYRPAALASAYTWDIAHNSWLELAAEMGLPFAAALGVLWAATLVKLARGGAAAALGVGLLGALHGLVDFSLQVSGFALVFAALIGGGLAQCRPPGRPRRRRGRTTSAAPALEFAR